MTVWYRPIKIYDGYDNFDYSRSVDRAFDMIAKKPALYKGNAYIKYNVWYSGGRPGMGYRRVSYIICK